MEQDITSLSTFFKTGLNGSYGYDGMNEEKFSKVSIKDRHQAFKVQMNDNFIDTRKLCENKYTISEKSRYYKCSTPLQEEAFTLDNAKYWYLNFYYNFFVKAIDMEKVHVTHLDSDSCYFAVAGNPNKDLKTQLFSEVI